MVLQKVQNGLNFKNYSLLHQKITLFDVVDVSRKSINGYFGIAGNDFFFSYCLLGFPTSFNVDK